MQNADPESPCLRPALSGLALAVLLAAGPAAADEPAVAAGAFDMAPQPGDARDAAAAPSRRWSFLPEAVTLRLSGAGEGHGPASFGLAVRIADGFSLGAGGAFDPGSAELVGVISLDIRL